MTCQSSTAINLHIAKYLYIIYIIAILLHITQMLTHGAPLLITHSIQDAQVSSLQMPVSKCKG